MIGRYLSPVREAGVVGREWVSVGSRLPGWALLRLEFVTDVSARAWRNAIISVLVGLVATVLAAFVMREVD